MMAKRDEGVLDALLLNKEAGFFDMFKAPEIPRFLAPTPHRVGMGRRQDLRKTQQKEAELWNIWDQGGRKPIDLKPLHDSFKPVITKQVRVFSGKVTIPTSAIHHEMNKQFVNAMKSYDPGRGTKLSTWVTTNLKKGQRFIKTYQNLGRIPEGQIKLITPYRRAVDELTDELGHEPDTQTIADRMGEPIKRIIQLEKENRPDLAVSGFLNDPAEVLAPKELEAFKLIQYDLQPEERTVYEYTFGMNGKPALKPGQIAQKTGIHASKISRIRKKLQGKVREAMEILE